MTDTEIRALMLKIGAEVSGDHEPVNFDWTDEEGRFLTALGRGLVDAGVERAKIELSERQGMTPSEEFCFAAGRTSGDFAGYARGRAEALAEALVLARGNIQLHQLRNAIRNAMERSRP